MLKEGPVKRKQLSEIDEKLSILNSATELINEIAIKN